MKFQVPPEPPSIKERAKLSLSHSLATAVQDTSATGELVAQTHSHATTAQPSDDSYTSCHHDCLLHTCSRLDTSEMHTSRGELMDFVKSALLWGPPETNDKRILYRQGSLHSPKYTTC